MYSGLQSSVTLVEASEIKTRLTDTLDHDLKLKAFLCLSRNPPAVLQHVYACFRPVCIQSLCANERIFLCDCLQAGLGWSYCHYHDGHYRHTATPGRTFST